MVSFLEMYEIRRQARNKALKVIFAVGFVLGLGAILGSGLCGFLLIIGALICPWIVFNAQKNAVLNALKLEAGMKQKEK